MTQATLRRIQPQRYIPGRSSTSAISLVLLHLLGVGRVFCRTRSQGRGRLSLHWTRSSAPKPKRKHPGNTPNDAKHEI